MVKTGSIRNLPAHLSVAGGLGSLLLAIQPLIAQSSALSYHGFLSDQGRPANAIYDLRFTLYDAANDGWVAAAPVDGAANQALRSLLADALGCPRSAIEIVQGKRARRKVVRLRGLSADAVRRRLASRAPLPPVARGVQGGSVVSSPPCGSMRGGWGVAGGSE